MVCVRRAAGRWPFPRPPWPSSVSGLAFEAFPSTAFPLRPQRCKHHCLRARSAACVTFTLLERLTVRAGPLPVLLFPCFALSPLHQRSWVCPLPAHVAACLRSVGAIRPTRSAPGVSHPFDGLLHTQVLGLVASRNRSLGSPCFQHLSPGFPEPTLIGPCPLGRRWCVPHDAFHTLQSLPLPGSHPPSPRPVLRRVRGVFTGFVALLPLCRTPPLPFVPSCDRRPVQTLPRPTLDFRALLHRGVRCACPPLPADRARCSPGLCSTSRPVSFPRCPCRPTGPPVLSHRVLSAPTRLIPLSVAPGSKLPGAPRGSVRGPDRRRCCPALHSEECSPRQAIAFLLVVRDVKERSEESSPRSTTGCPGVVEGLCRGRANSGCTQFQGVGAHRIGRALHMAGQRSAADCAWGGPGSPDFPARSRIGIRCSTSGILFPDCLPHVARR